MINDEHKIYIMKGILLRKFDWHTSFDKPFRNIKITHHLMKLLEILRRHIALPLRILDNLLFNTISKPNFSHTLRKTI